MRALVQRVSEARVRVVGVGGEELVGQVVGQGFGQLEGEIGPGLCVLLGVTHTDDDAVARKIAEKLWHLRIFDDADGVMNRSVVDVGGQILVVSQFTLYGDTRKGRRPSWVAAAPPEQAERLVEAVVAALTDLGAHVETGRFRADMAVELVNDGPVTLLVEV